MSALSPKDIAALRERLIRFFVEELPETELLIPYNQKGVIGEIRRNVHVVGERHEANGVQLKVRADARTLTSIKKRIRG
jgi:GTP-binding protein HflX